MMNFNYYFASEPMELETKDSSEPMDIDGIYNAIQPTDMDIDVPVPSPKRRFQDLETGSDEDEILCPPIKKKRKNVRKIIQAKRPHRQVKVVPALLYFIF